MTDFSLIDGITTKLKIGIAKYQYFDFNRYRYFNVPSKLTLAKSHFANRDDIVLRWFRVLSSSHEQSDSTKHGYINDLVKYVRFADLHKLDLESKETISRWEQNLVEKVRLGSMHVNTARKINSSIKCLFKLLELPVQKWFSSRGLFRSEVNPTEGYSDKEIKTLLRLLHPLFRQLHKQIVETPEIHINAQPRDHTAVVSLQGRKIEVAGVITKCFALGYFLMSYFTWGNMTTLLKMKKFSEENLSKGNVYSQSVFKSRANKYVTISIGDNNTQHVPKHALSFIEKLLQLSRFISAEDDHLFYQVSRGKSAPLESYHLCSATNWLLDCFNPLDETGLPLRPLAKRFRASGSVRYLDITGDAIGTAFLLGNTPQTLRRHYTTGSPIENRKQLQAAAHTMEAMVKCSDLSESKEYAKKQLDVEVLPHDAFLEKYSRINNRPQTTVIGSGCKKPFGEEADTYRKKINFSPKTLDVDHLACADILKCFSCPNQVIIEEVEDIWCLLSFKEAINDSLRDHVNSTQFMRNFKDLIDKIEFAIFSVNPAIRRKAIKKLKNEGRHPVWPENINYLF
jgi:hypothetical protein